MNRELVVRFVVSLFFAVVIGVASGYQILGVSRDYDNYFQFFNLVRAAPSYWGIQYRFEPAFTMFVYGLVNLNFTNWVVYSVIAGTIVFVKFFSIEFVERYWFAVLVFAFYLVSRYVLLFEMTVLRAACALALAFIVFYRKEKSGIQIRDLIVLSCAVLFHYSAVIFLFIYIIPPVSRLRIVIVSVAVFVLIVLGKHIALSYLPDYLSVFTTYEEFGKATIFPIPLMVDMAFFAFAIYHFDKADLAMRYAIFGMAMCFAFHFSLIDYSLLAARFRELLSVFFLIYLVRVVYSEDRQMIGCAMAYALFSGAMYFFVEFYYEPLLS
jgi:hypothetical protein